MTGIYKITNTLNAMIYIGSSQDVALRRKTHWNQLRRRIHSNTKLQCAWNKYGESAFELTVIISDVPKEELTRVEQREIDRAKNAGISVYNLRPVADSQRGIKLGPMPRHVADKISASRMGIEPWNKGLSYELPNRKGKPTVASRMWASKTHCPRGHAYDSDNTLIANSGQRQCRACARTRARTRRLLKLL